MDAIVIENLSKVYRSHLGKVAARPLKGLRLTVQENHVFGFLGKNGAGKTTTIKILCSLLRPSGGRATVFGENTASREARAYIGYLPENPYFYEYLTPRETLDFYGRLQGLKRSDREGEWERLSKLLRLEDIAHQRVRGFSKGMRQRLGMAVALVGDPKVLILDEPMTGLDPLGRRLIREVILRMRDAHKTIFFSSHVLSDVEQICDRVGILVDGQLMVEGRIEDLLQRQVTQVEVVARGLKDVEQDGMETGVDFVRESDRGVHFMAQDLDTANRLVRTIQDRGGHLYGVFPVGESLEDYFMRQQEQNHADSGSST